ncbi:MAG: hypothetical protein ACTTJ3_01570 [Treponema sp.]
MKKNILKSFTLITISLLVSCATSKFDVVSFEKAYSEGDYELCVKMLKSKKYEKDSMPLKNMDIAILLHYAKDYDASQKYFAECERLMEQGNLRSIAQFESFYLNILNSFNYYNQGKLEDAVVEIKKADHEKVNQGRQASNSLWFIVDDSSNVATIRGFDEDEKDGEEYHKACSKFGVSPAEASRGTPRKPTVNDLYRSSPTAYYLGSLFREANGDTEGARLDRDYLKVLNPKINFVKDNEKAVLNVVAFSGSIAKKKEKSYYFPPEVSGVPIYLPDVIVIDDDGVPMTIPGLRYKFAYTQAGENETNVNRIEAIATNIKTSEETKAQFSFLEDFGEELKKNVALKARREFQKNKIKSIIGKSALAISLTIAVYAARKAVDKASDDVFAKTIADIALSAAELAFRVGLEKFDNSIKADTRQAKYLPARSYATSLSLDEGTYNVKVQYMKGNLVLNEDVFENVNIKQSHLNLLESICLD